MKKWKSFSILLVTFLFVSCGKKKEYTTPEISNITESIYASGIVVSRNQYDLFPKVSGQVAEILIEVGDSVHVGDPILRIESEIQRINNRNALLTTNYYSFSNNQDELDRLKNAIELARIKKEFDSTQYERQKKLFKKGVGTEIDLETARLNYENAVLSFQNSKNQYNEFKRQLRFNASQAKNNLQVSSISESDFTVFSKVDGIVYQLDCSVGELVTPQRPVGVLGDKEDFVLEMLIDETDILRIQTGQPLVIRLDSYKDVVFDAKISKIYPYMDPQSKSFKLEARFINPPERLYPNMNFEANILLASKEDALLIPREYLLKDSLVIRKKDDTIAVKTGLRDYEKIEILSGLKPSDIIQKPE